MRYGKFFVFTVLALTCSPLLGAEKGEENPPVAAAETPLPSAAALQKLARKALAEATGRRMHVGPVTLREKLADGSWLVDITLEDGRQVKGRLYRSRRRFRIAVDLRDLFSLEKNIKIVK